jgi:hypothetical protein
MARRIVRFGVIALVLVAAVAVISLTGALDETDERQIRKDAEQECSAIITGYEEYTNEWQNCVDDHVDTH